MFLTIFTVFHTLLSLVGIATGFVVVNAFLRSRRAEKWASAFLVFNIATCVTGFFFPFHGVTPAIILGVVDSAVLGLAAWAHRSYSRSGSWGGTYAASMVTALYLNFFVLIVQMFQKIPFLNALAPTQTEPPFQISQLLALLVFGWLAIRSAMKLRRPLRST